MDQMRDSGGAAQRPRPMGVELPIGTGPEAIRQRLELMEMLLERSIVIPGTRRAIGLDAVAGLIPVVGDFITAGLGMYLVWEARNLGLPKWKLWRMAGNVGVDALLGSVPLAGDVFDVFFRSNTRNLRIVKRHLDKVHPASKVIEG